MSALDKDASAGLIIRQMVPRNLEAPFDQADSYLTPTTLFYIRTAIGIISMETRCAARWEK